MGWVSKFFDNAFEKYGEVHPIEDFINAGDPVMGKSGNIRSVRGRAVGDQYDYFGTPTVKVRWEDGRETTVPCDMVVSMVR